jgi:hypothetical protein
LNIAYLQSSKDVKCISTKHQNEKMEIVMISVSVSLSATSSIHGVPINRGTPLIVPYSMASFHLFSIFLLKLGTKFIT